MKNKKPKKKYVPRDVNPAAWIKVVHRTRLLDDDGKSTGLDILDVNNAPALVVLRAKNHSAMQALTTGEGTPEQMTDMIEAINVSLALSEIRPGLGKEFAAELQEASDALYNMGCRALSRNNRLVFTAAEMECLNYFLQIYDAQLSAATVWELEKAGELVNWKLRNNRLRHFKPLEVETL